MPSQPSQRKPAQITLSKASRQPTSNFEISRLSVAGQVLAEIRRRSPHWEIPDQLPFPLPEAPIAESLGVSRVPGREAFTRLKDESLLVPGRRNTLMVRPFTRADWRQITVVRLPLEPLAAGSLQESKASTADHTRIFEAIENGK